MQLEHTQNKIVEKKQCRSESVEYRFYIDLLLLKIYMDYWIEWRYAYFIKKQKSFHFSFSIAKSEINIDTIFYGDYNNDKYALMSFEEFKAWTYCQLEFNSIKMYD